MKKNVFRIVLILIILVLGIVLQEKAQDYTTIIKISNATKEITNNSQNVQVRVTEKYTNGSEKIAETYIKDGVFVTRRIDGKNTPANSIQWATNKEDVICNAYYEYEFEHNGEVVKGLNCTYNYNNGSETQKVTRLATGNLLLMFDRQNMGINILNMPKIEDIEYGGKACYALKTEFRTWYIDKETLRTIAIDCKVFEDDSPYFYTFEYDIDAPEGIYDEPKASGTYYDEVIFTEISSADRYKNINNKKEKAISGTNLKPGEELIEVVELKDGEILNFLGLTDNEFGLKGFNINTLKMYNKFREKYSGLRELTEEDFEEYYVAITYKEGNKLKHLQSVSSTKNNKVNYVFDTEKSNKESLALIVTPLTDDSSSSIFIKNKEKFNISEDDAIKTVSENIKELNSELVLDVDNYVNVESSQIVKLDNEIFAGLDVIKTPVKGKEPMCWKLTVVDGVNKKLDAYVDIMSGSLIGSKNR